MDIIMNLVKPTKLHSTPTTNDTVDTHTIIKDELNQYINIIETDSPLNEVDYNTMIDNLQSMNETLQSNVYIDRVDNMVAYDLMLDINDTLQTFFSKNSLGDAGLPITDIDVQQGSSF